MEWRESRVRRYHLADTGVVPVSPHAFTLL
jgi:hypothetical protein